jgi:glycosyltransferase involved in cell wall biosynthesis
VTTLSVIVPMRDVAPYIEDLLVSLTRNASEDFEFIFVDDGSVDLTAELLEKYRKRLPGFTVIRQDRSYGPSVSRNTGMKAASGRYLTFLDGDDWIVPGYLPDLVAAIESLGCDFVKTDHVQMYGARRVITRAPQGRRGVVLAPRDGILPHIDETMVDYPYSWAGIYDRRMLDAGLLTFDEDLHTAEDRPWIWRQHRLAESYAVVSLTGVYYRRQVNDSLTQIGDERQLHFFPAFDRVLAELADDPDRERFRRKALHTYLAIICRQVNLSERLTPALLRKLLDRARGTLRRMDQEELTLALPGLGKERADLITDLRDGKAILQ